MGATAKPAEGPKATTADASEHTKTVVIYSPDLNFCFSLSMLLQDRYNVITTTNLGMLEKFVAEYGAHLLIVDAVPSDALVQRLDCLRGISRGLPIILLYVYNARDTLHDKAIRARVDAVFYKPFDVSAVSRRIEELLPD